MKLDANALQQLKGKGLIPMLTAYTSPVARCLERAGIPVILVGDSLAMVEMGFSSTKSVSIDNMKYHIGAVRRGAENTHIIGDMTFGSDEEPENALINARGLIDAGADSVKLEGPKLEVIKYLVNNSIDVVGHTGLTPQTAQNFKQVGKGDEEAQRVIEEAKGITKAGAFMIVLEHIPAELGNTITQTIPIATIGIGAGPHCDGQVLVINDAIGLGDYWPPFSKQYAHVDKMIEDVASAFKEDVENKKFP